MRARSFLAAPVLALLLAACGKNPQPYGAQLEAGQTVVLKGTCVSAPEEPKLRFLTEAGEILGIGMENSAEEGGIYAEWIQHDLACGQDYVYELRLTYMGAKQLAAYRSPLPCFSIDAWLNAEFLGVGDYIIAGERWDKQIHRKTKRGSSPVTDFDNWENIGSYYVSPDKSRMVVYHRPDKQNFWLISLYDLSSGQKLAELAPGFACRGVRWTNDYIVYEWGTTGGGQRREYRDKDSLALSHTVQASWFFEAPEDDALIGIPYFCTAWEPITAYSYNSGQRRAAIPHRHELGELYFVQSCKKTGQRTYTVQLDPSGEGTDTIEAVLEL